MINWTSVDDELPHDGAKVIVYIRDRGSVINTAYLSGNFGLALSPFDKAGVGVTHWSLINIPAG